ncbi:patatin-like phospholipase family protein [uncultured Pseudodesulfovibrio sp.]|uniref:patatin-like phospholipase family protein n=1 Tax=uncultured Pseudodesulfovibrio sp. TaxID=2035858 RepID=UPI0029C68C0E|nr:patatin-like phospholipase family protein [uncultured Pseudodesulfovibrio sp.]
MRPLPHTASVLAMLILCTGLLCACAPKRNGLPATLQTQATINGLAPDTIRSFGDTAPKHMDQGIGSWATVIQNGPYASAPLTMLSLSGGGADGAFGAGILSGWSARGNRPTFTMVTGISTGALIAPFAFLGPEYDMLLKLFYTTFSTEDLARPLPVGSAISRNGFFSTKPLREALKQYISTEVITKIATEYRKGRRLIIGTTNLDLMRPVYWDIGAIAQHRSEKNDQLIRDIILASVSVPVAFPPVFISLEADGKTYDEMHVDGGVTNQVFAYPVSLDLKKVLAQFSEKRSVSLYVIRNGTLTAHAETVEASLADIAEKSMTSLIRNQGIGDLYRIYYTAQRDSVDFHLAFIPPSFQEKPEEDEMFSTPYMKELFHLGYNTALHGDPWHDAPPADFSRR